MSEPPAPRTPSRATVVVDELPAASTPDPVETGRGLDLVGSAGSGAMGEVWIATDRDLGRTVAFKVLRAELAANPQRVARFHAEARTAAALDHPGVVPIHGLMRADDGRLGYTMKLVRGRTLAAWLAAIEGRGASAGRSRRPTPDTALPARLEVFLKVCDAVSFAHAQAVLHRDLKPENIMLGDHGEVYVMDWGVAVHLDERLGGQRPEHGARVGTPGFAAPEAGPDLRDVRTDVYSLGVLLRELATLADGRTAPGALPRADRHGRRVPTEIGAIVAKATAAAPDARYADVRALAEDIRRYLAGEAVAALPDTPWRAALRFTGRHRRTVLAVLGAAVALGCVAVAVAGWSESARWRDRSAAADAERAVTAFVGASAAQAAQVDARLVRYQGVAQAFAATAVERFRSAGPTAPVFTPDAFRDPARAPADLAPSPVYTTPVSLDEPVVMWVGDDESLVRAAARLATLGPVARDRMARSVGEPLAPDVFRARALTEGVPLAFLSVAFESGVWMSYPGHGSFAPDYDARARPWYTVARDADDAVWGAPYADTGGLGLLLPCSVPLRDGDTFLGVASVKLSLRLVIGDLLAPPEGIDGEVFVVDGDGTLLMRTHQPTGPDAVPAAAGDEAALFPNPAVVAGVRARKAGMVRDGAALVSWHPLTDLGWALVVRGAPPPER